MKKRTLSAVILGLLSVNSIANNRVVSVITCESHLRFAIDDINCVVNNGTTPTIPGPVTPPAHPWFIFAQAHGQLFGESDVSGYERKAATFGGLAGELEDSDLPQVNIGVSTIEALGFPWNKLTHLNFMNGVETLNDGLYFRDNYISDISGLSDLKNTNTNTVIFLEHNSLTDVNALNNVSTFKTLNLSNNNLSNISGLSGLRDVESLVINSNSISDVSSLQNMSFKSLYAYENNISDISMLKIEPRVTHLRLRNNNISDISVLSGSNNIVTVTLSHNTGITDISALSNNPSVVENYSFTNTGISNIDSLSHIVEADLLAINVLSNLTNVNGLSNLQKANSIYMNANPSLTNVDGLSNLKEITNFLELSNSGLTNVNGLSGLTSANKLVLYGNRNLTDISGISNLTNVSQYLVLDEPSQYSTKLSETSAFCKAYNNGDIALVRTASPANRTIGYSEICLSAATPDPTPPPTGNTGDGWMEFLNDYSNSSGAFDYDYNQIIMTDESEMENLIIEVYDDDSSIPDENFPITNNNEEIYIYGTTHVNYMSSLTSAYYIEIDSIVTDISGLENISIIDDQGIYFYDPTTITKKADINSDFCQGLISGDVWAYDENFNDLTQADLCE